MSEILADIASERGVCAAICLYGKDSYLEVCDIISAACFTQQINQNLYTVLDYIFKKDLEAKVDLAKILSAAKELGLQKNLAEENSYIQRLFTFKVEKENTREFGQKIKRLEIARTLVGLFSDTQESIKKLSGAEPLSQIVSVAEMPIFNFINSLTDNNRQIEAFHAGVEDYIDKLMKSEDNRFIDIESPIWQRAIGGLRTGVHVVSARPKAGKSTHALCSSLRASKTVPVLYLDTEMDKEQGVWDRALSLLSGIDINTIIQKKLTEADAFKLGKAAKKLKTLNMDYYNISGRDFDEVKSLVRRWLIQNVKFGADGKLNKCLMTYDYIKMTDYAALKVAKEYEIIGMRMSGLHDLTMMYNFPILTYIQLNREMGVSQSDRVTWFCTSMSQLLKKDPAEIATDGPQNGNRKIMISECRFGGGLEDGDYINYNLDGKHASIKELGLGSAVERDTPNEGES